MSDASQRHISSRRLRPSGEEHFDSRSFEASACLKMSQQEGREGFTSNLICTGHVVDKRSCSCLFILKVVLVRNVSLTKFYPKLTHDVSVDREGRK